MANWKSETNEEQLCAVHMREKKPAYYIALYGTIQPSGPMPLVDKIVEIVTDAVRTNKQVKPSNRIVMRFVYVPLCDSASWNINLEYPVESKRNHFTSIAL